MGLFSSDNSAADDSNRLADEQMQMNQAEIETKRQSLAQARINIVKSQGGEQWSPTLGGISAPARPSPFRKR